MISAFVPNVECPAELTRLSLSFLRELLTTANYKSFLPFDPTLINCPHSPLG